MSRRATVDEYLAGFPAPQAARLGEIRALCLAAAPLAEETLKWGAPGDLVRRLLAHRVREWAERGVRWM